MPDLVPVGAEQAFGGLKHVNNTASKEALMSQLKTLCIVC